MIDILVLNYNDAATTTNFVKSIRNYSCVRTILVVDNHSKDDSLNCLKSLEDEKVVVIDSGENKGYGTGNNIGIRYLFEHYQAEYVLLSNPDVIVKENVLIELEKFLKKNNDYAIVAPFMLNAKRLREKNTAFRIPSKWEYILSISLLLTKCNNLFYYKNLEKETKRVIDVGSVTGSMFMMRTKDMLKYGMFDENIFLYCEEIVLGIKIQKAHKKIALMTEHTFVHNHSVSISKTYKSVVAKQRLLIKSKLYVLKRYFNINLFEYFIALFLSKMSIVEIFILGFLRRSK